MATTKKQKIRSIKRGGLKRGGLKRGGLKRGGNNKTKKCMDTKCKLWLKEAAKNTAMFKKVIETNYKNGLVKFKKDCETNTKNQATCDKIKNDIDLAIDLLIK